MRSETDLQMVLELYREEFEPRYPLIETMELCCWRRPACVWGSSS
jgi:hypothetical protein